MNLNVFQFALPLVTNDGKADYSRQLTVWEELAIDEGGYTDLGVRRGAWRADDGRVLRDEMRWYQFAGDDAAASRLMKAALSLFPDQESFYVGRLGTANVVINDLKAVPPKALPPIYTRKPYNRLGVATMPGDYDPKGAI